MAGLAQDVAGLARRVEHPLVHGQHHRAGALGRGWVRSRAWVLQSRISMRCSKMRTSTLAADGRRARGVAAVIHPHAAVVADGALGLGEILHAQQRQG
jgi:hypothetical protein